MKPRHNLSDGAPKRRSLRLKLAPRKFRWGNGAHGRTVLKLTVRYNSCIQIKSPNLLVSYLLDISFPLLYPVSLQHADSFESCVLCCENWRMNTDLPMNEIVP
jgi:hypothetical protein